MNRRCHLRLPTRHFFCARLIAGNAHSKLLRGCSMIQCTFRQAKMSIKNATRPTISLAWRTSFRFVFPFGNLRLRFVWPRLINTNVEHGTPNQAVPPITMDRASLIAAANPAFVNKFIFTESNVISYHLTRKPSWLQAVVRLPVPQNHSTN